MGIEYLVEGYFFLYVLANFDLLPEEAVQGSGQNSVVCFRWSVNEINRQKKLTRQQEHETPSKQHFPVLSKLSFVGRQKYEYVFYFFGFLRQTSIFFSICYQYMSSCFLHFAQYCSIRKLISQFSLTSFSILSCKYIFVSRIASYTKTRNL